MISQWTPPGTKIVALTSAGCPWLGMCIVMGRVYTVEQMVEVDLPEPGEICVRVAECDHSRLFTIQGHEGGWFINWDRRLFRRLITPDEFTDAKVADETDTWDKRRIPSKVSL